MRYRPCLDEYLLGPVGRAGGGRSADGSSELLEAVRIRSVDVHPPKGPCCVHSVLGGVHLVVCGVVVVHRIVIGGRIREEEGHVFGFARGRVDALAVAGVRGGCYSRPVVAGAMGALEGGIGDVVIRGLQTMSKSSLWATKNTHDAVEAMGIGHAV